MKSFKSPIYIELAQADTPEKAISFIKKYGALINPYLYLDNYKLYNINEGIPFHFGNNKETMDTFLMIYEKLNNYLSNNFIDNRNLYLHDYIIYNHFSFYQKEIKLLLEIKYQIGMAKSEKPFLMII